MVVDPTPESTTNHWYEVVTDGTLRQGEILQDLKVPVLADDCDLTASAEKARCILKGPTWIVMSPSCDLEHTKIPRVLVAECVQVETDLNLPEGKTRGKILEALRRGVMHDKFLLPDTSLGPGLKLSVASNRNIAAVPTASLKAFVEGRTRLRLRHPYREQFGNWCGSWVSRVGPEDVGEIPRFVKQLRPEQVADVVDEADQSPR